MTKKARRKLLILLSLAGTVLLIFSAWHGTNRKINASKQTPYFNGERPDEAASWYVRNPENTDFTWGGQESSNPQPYVVNPIGGSNPSQAAGSWPQPWNELENNFTNDYLSYSNGSHEDFAIRQFARQTETEGRFDVFTSIRGNMLPEREPLSIVLVADHSSSMNTDGRMAGLQNAINRFSEDLENIMTEQGIHSNDVRVGYLSYGTGVNNSADDLNNGRYVPIKDFNRDQKAKLMKATPSSADSNQYTFTQAALRSAGTVLSQEGKRKKVIILLTDGVPTQSNAITEGIDKDGNGIVGTVGDRNSNTIDASEISETTQANTGIIHGQTWTDSREIDRSHYPSVNPNSRLTERSLKGDTSASTPSIYNSTFPATLFEAEKLKHDIEIHGIGINLETTGGNTQYPALSQEQIEENFKALVTNPYYFVNIYNPTDLENYLTHTLEKLFNTIPDGSVRIKLGSQFQIAGNIKTEYFQRQRPMEANGRPAAVYSNNLVSLDRLSLGKNQEVRIHHQVQIKTENNAFETLKWYPISQSEETTFTPDISAHSSPVTFLVPSGRAPGTMISLTKEWDDNNNESGLRPDRVDFTITRDNNTLHPDWSLAKSLGTENWTANVQEVPLFNNDGEKFTYQIHESPIEYYNAEPEIINNGSNHFNITNIYTGPQIRLEVNKIDDDFHFGPSYQHPLPGALFKLSKVSEIPSQFPRQMATKMTELQEIYVLSDKSGAFHRIHQSADGTWNFVSNENEAGNFENSYVNIAFGSKYKLEKITESEIIQGFTFSNNVYNNYLEKARAFHLKLGNQTIWYLETDLPHVALKERAVGYVLQEGAEVPTKLNEDTENEHYWNIRETISSESEPGNELNRRKVATPTENPINTTIVSFAVMSNILHEFNLHKVDSQTHQGLSAASFSIAQYNSIIFPIDNPSAGSRFDSLESLVDDFSEPMEIRTTDSDGLINLFDLARGNVYLLRETTAPDGYRRSKVGILIYMDENQETHVHTAELEDNRWKIVDWGDYWDESHRQLTFFNVSTSHPDPSDPNLPSSPNRPNFTLTDNDIERNSGILPLLGELIAGLLLGAFIIIIGLIGLYLNKKRS